MVYRNCDYFDALTPYEPARGMLFTQIVHESRLDGRVGYGARLRNTLITSPGRETCVGSSPTLVTIFLFLFLLLLLNLFCHPATHQPLQELYLNIESNAEMDSRLKPQPPSTNRTWEHQKD